MVEDEQTQVKSIGKPAPEKLINSSRDSPPRTLYLLHKQDTGGRESVPKGRLKIAQDGPGFPVQVGGTKEPRAAFREESRIRRPVQSSVQETRG